MLTDEERELLEWQQDRHTPVVHATGFVSDEDFEEAMAVVLDRLKGVNALLAPVDGGDEYPGCE